MNVVLILVSVISLSIVFVIILALTGGSKSGGSGKKQPKQLGNAAGIKVYSKKLMHNPLDKEALLGLAQIYFVAGAYDKAFPLYQKLFALLKTELDLDQKTIALRYGLCAYKCEKFEDAKAGFQKIIVLDQLNYDANFYLGKMYYDAKEYEKAVGFLKRAANADAMAKGANEILGYALFEAKRFRESLPYIRRAIDQAPQDKKLLYYFACGLEESSMDDKALKVFLHLRMDKDFGPQSCLFCGKLHDKMGQYETAMQDYEIALKIDTIPPDIKVEVLYNLAQDYIRAHNIAKALTCLQGIMTINSQYKDVARLVATYGELNQNNNLQLYLLSGPSDFVALCKKIVTNFYKNCFVKIVSVEVSSSNVDVQCSVETTRWTSTEYFRFFRTASIVGQLLVVDCFNKVKDSKFDKGYCVSAGSFSEESKKFVEGRPIDLIDKTELVKVLKRIKL